MEEESREEETGELCRVGGSSEGNLSRLEGFERIAHVSIHSKTLIEDEKESDSNLSNGENIVRVDCLLEHTLNSVTLPA